MSQTVQITQGTVHEHGAWRIGVGNVFVQDGAPVARIAIARRDGQADEQSHLHGIAGVVAIGAERYRVQAIVVGQGGTRGCVELARIESS